jgi:hypothetical protein
MKLKHKLPRLTLHAPIQVVEPTTTAESIQLLTNFLQTEAPDAPICALCISAPADATAPDLIAHVVTQLFEHQHQTFAVVITRRPSESVRQ